MWYFFMPQGVLHPLHAWSGAPGPLAKPKLTSKHIANIAYPNPSPGSGIREGRSVFYSSQKSAENLKESKIVQPLTMYSTAETGV